MSNQKNMKPTVMYNFSNTHQFYFYESFFTVDRLLCNLRTDSSNKSIQSRPFSSKKLATDFLKVVSRLAPVLPSLNTNTRSYWSSNLQNKYYKIKPVFILSKGFFQKNYVFSQVWFFKIVSIINLKHYWGGCHDKLLICGAQKFCTVSL